MRTPACQRDHSTMPSAHRATIEGLDCSQDTNNARWACPMCCFLAGADAVLAELADSGKINSDDVTAVRNHLAMAGQGFP